MSILGLLVVICMMPWKPVTISPVPMVVQEYRKACFLESLSKVGKKVIFDLRELEYRRVRFLVCEIDGGQGTLTPGDITTTGALVPEW